MDCAFGLWLAWRAGVTTQSVRNEEDFRSRSPATSNAPADCAAIMTATLAKASPLAYANRSRKAQGARNGVEYTLVGYA
jgi:hypothetical protein